MEELLTTQPLWMLWGHGLQNELCYLGPYQQHKSQLGCQL